MPILFASTASLGGPSRNVSMASRYILRAMKMSPRISGDSEILGAGDGAAAATLVPSSIALDCVCANAKLKPAAISAAMDRENIKGSPPCELILLPKSCKGDVLVVSQR